MDVSAYLKRINYDGSRAASADTLRALQKAHLMTVPFENLSIHRGEPIMLNDEALFDKIVVRRRGGFCYELNGLFAGLLRALGFTVTMLSAQVAMAEGGYSPDFDHMTLLVTLEERWLVDVGFGDSFREPLRLHEEEVQAHDGRAYQIHCEDGHRILKERKEEGDWTAQYRFMLTPFQYSDFKPRCHFHQTSDESHFRKKKVCSRATPGGRLTVTEGRLITTSLNGERQERELRHEADYTTVLREQFGIVLTP